MSITTAEPHGPSSTKSGPARRGSGLRRALNRRAPRSTTLTGAQVDVAGLGKVRRQIAWYGGIGLYIRGWFAAGLVAWAHVAVINWVTYATGGGPFASVAFLGCMAIPVVVTSIKIPQARSGWWRWLVLLVVVGLSGSYAALVAIVIGETVLLRRAWISQRRLGFDWAPRPTPRAPTVAAAQSGSLRNARPDTEDQAGRAAPTAGQPRTRRSRPDMKRN